MDLHVKDSLYILTIDKAILVMTKAEFIAALKRGKWWRRQQATAPRHAAMRAQGDAQRRQRQMYTP